MKSGFRRRTAGQNQSPRLSELTIAPGDRICSDPIAKHIAENYYHDPYGHVLFSYPWGEPGTELEHESGPDEWQREALQEIGRQSKAGVTCIRIAVSSGHGVGKGAFCSWVIRWFGDTRGDAKIVVTANTETQLQTKTWSELAKWHHLGITSHWWRHTATRYANIASPDTWFAAAIPWNKSRPQSFAGTHAKAVLYVFDEASEIESVIWDTSEGAMTQPGAMWLALGNPSMATGRFWEVCWGRFRNRWKLWCVDSRTAKMSSQTEIHRQWIEDYGEDSDFCRVRIRGLPPRQGMEQFIGTQLIEDAAARKIDRKSIAATVPRIMGFDPGASARVLSSCALCRQGPLAIPESVARWSISDQMQLAAQVAHYIDDWMPDLVFIDCHGIGKAVYDRLIQLGYDMCVDVYWGVITETLDREVYGNPRIEIWDRLKTWLKTGSIPQDVQLKIDLGAPKKIFDKSHRMWLEPKEAMHARGVDSPHAGDALALTFAEPVPLKRGEEGSGGGYLEPEVG